MLIYLFIYCKKSAAAITLWWLSGG